MSVTAHIPKSWYAPAHECWLKEQRSEAIQQTIEQINGYPVDQKPTALVLQLTYYLFFINDYASALMILEKQAEYFPTHIEILTNLAVNYSRAHNYAKAIEYSQKVLALVPTNALCYDIMSSCYHELKEDSKAADAGTQSLRLKDKACAKVKPNNWRLPKQSPQSIALVEGKQNVISFSLWGGNPRYLRGALRNVLLAPDFYSGWVVRINVDDSVPKEFIKLVSELGAQVVVQPRTLSIREKLCWRFQVANDPLVGYFLVRDADSVFSVREVNAVSEWLASDRFFHVMRDWWTHTDLMLAGMWGGVSGVLPNLSEMLTSYVSDSVETPNIDQWFLRDKVWAYVRSSCMMHDRCFNLPGTRVLQAPDFGNAHIGQNEIAVHANTQAQFLKPWIERYACLQL